MITMRWVLDGRAVVLEEFEDGRRSFYETLDFEFQTEPKCNLDAMMDASPEVKDAVLAVRAASELVDTADMALYKARAESERLERERQRQDVMVIGRRVRVTRKRAKGYGKEGVVCWSGRLQWGDRLGIRLDGDEIFYTARRNCEVVDAIADAAEAAEESALAALEQARARAVAAIAARCT